ncbi:hypothetical protein C8J56DRAFT_961510 [Mycena floridula]|nr:hypothetical protein C8J56DRAFT_961510 [Mycena floridula]
MLQSLVPFLLCLPFKPSSLAGSQFQFLSFHFLLCLASLLVLNIISLVFSFYCVLRASCPEAFGFRYSLSDGQSFFFLSLRLVCLPADGDFCLLV